MKKSSPLIFFGNERLSSGFDASSAPVLRTLIAHGYEIAAIVSNYEPGRSRTKRPLEIETIAKDNSIPVLLPAHPQDIVDQLAGYHPSAGILVAYGKIIPQSIIDLFPHGIINLHPSLLPRYRGPTPIEQAILDGAPETGISIMQLARKMDAGPIYRQARLPLKGDEQKTDLTQTLLELGAQELLSLLPDLLAGNLTPTPQNEATATYCHLLKKSGGELDPNHKTAAQLEREVRAYLGYPKSRLELFGHSIIVTRAHVTQKNDSAQLVIPCYDNSFLVIDQLVAPSGRQISGADFIRGYAKP